jgi:hypothetical protein
MKKRIPSPDEELSGALDSLIDGAEDSLRRGSTSTTSRLLTGLDEVLWEVARMQDTLRAAQPEVVTVDDIKALKKAFGRINREAEMLVRWLRYTHLEQPRN